MRTNSRHLRRGGALLLIVGLITALFGFVGPAASAEGETPVVTLEDGVNGCNGVRPTPGSENTTKRLDPAFPSNFDPGGIVGYIIDYPVDPEDVAGRETFVITDCVFVNDGESDVAVAKYTVTFVPNTEAYQLRFSVPIAPDTPLGAQFCNYAKTTAAPSDSQASNRKAGPSCFTVGGGLRIEKRSGSVTGPLLPGASFSVVCTPAVAEPATIITGLSQQSVVNADGTVTASGVATSGAIAIVGPSGTPCTVTETAAPPGYQLDSTPRNLVIPVGTSQTIEVFVNLQLGDLVITKTTSGGTGTFVFDVNCDGTAFDRTVEITNSGSSTITGIPAGTSCTVTERANALFSSVVVPANGTVTIAPGSNTVAFTNTRLTGNLVVRKTTVGGTGTFTFDVDCDGTTWDQTFTITNSGEKTITGIPTGTSCTVTERPLTGWTSVFVPANGTVTIGVGSNTIAVTNTRNTGNLVVTKTTTGGSGTFTFTVDCSDDAFDQTFTLGSGTKTISGIPTGTTCTVTEQATEGWTSVSVPANGTVTIGLGTNTVAFTNTRDTGNLTIVKTTNGGSGTFTFDVDCTDNAFDQAVTIVGSGSKTITGIPTGTSCIVTERPNPLFSSVVVPPNGTVVIDADGATVAFTNTRLTGSLTVNKTTVGGSGTFTFDVDCSDDAFDQSFSITDSGSKTISGIPTTTTCTVTERANPLFSSTVQPAGGNVTISVGGQTVSFTNTRITGTLTVQKTTTGGSGTFVFDVDCDGTAYDTTVTIADSGSATVAGIPTTTTCTVTERANPLFASGRTPADGTVVIDADGESVAFTNAARPSAITLDKKVNGGDHATAGAALVVHAGDALNYTVTITNTGEIPLTVVTLTDSLFPGFALSCSQAPGSTLAAGASMTCAYTVTAGSDATNVAAVEGLDGFGRRPTASDATFVNVINPAIAITKTPSPAQLTGGGDVTFTYVVTNTGDTALTNVVVTDDILGAIGVVSSLAPGASATLTKTVTVDTGSPTRNVGTAVGTDVLGREVRATAVADIVVVLAEVIELPRTGAPLKALTLAGVALSLAGLALLVAGRRRNLA